MLGVGEQWVARSRKQYIWVGAEKFSVGCFAWRIALKGIFAEASQLGQKKKGPYPSPWLFSVVNPLLFLWLLLLAPRLQKARPECFLLPSPKAVDWGMLVSCYPIRLSKAVNKWPHMHSEVGYEKNLDCITTASCGDRVGEEGERGEGRLVALQGNIIF